MPDSMTMKTKPILYSQHHVPYKGSSVGLMCMLASMVDPVLQLVYVVLTGTVRFQGR